MAQGLRAKICGLSTSEAVDAALAGGASHIGVVFFPRSPRHIAPENAGALLGSLKTDVTRVGVVVDPSDAELDIILSAVPLDMIQLHGTESPARVAAIKTRFGLPVIKAVPIAEAADFEAATPYEPVADMLMFDAKPPKSHTDALPGGNALRFDWHLLHGRSWSVPWILSGGLDPDNVSDAATISGAEMVDVSSGVEDRPGVKSPAKIKSFMAAVAATKSGAAL